MNKSPLPVQDALYECDAAVELEIIKFDFEDNLILSNPASYFFTNKS